MVTFCFMLYKRMGRYVDLCHQIIVIKSKRLIETQATNSKDTKNNGNDNIIIIK